MTAIIQRSFAGGELAPALYARVDTTKYAAGLRTCRNFFVMRHGGASSRPGTSFVCEVKDSSKTVRMIPFVFNSDQTYILEFGNLYMRVIRDGAQQTESAKTITGITQAAQAVVTSAAHGFSNDQEVYLAAIGGMTELNGRNFKVSDATANTFKLKYMDGTTYVDSTAMTAYTSGGTASRVYTVTTPYVEADLSTLQFVQSADVLTITHLNYEPRKLSRIADTNWTLSTLTYTPSIAAPTGLTSPGPGNAVKWVVTAIDSETFEESLPSNEAGYNTNPSASSPLSISWNSVSGAVSYNIYRNLYGAFNWVGSSQTTTFLDVGLDADSSLSPPIERTPFASSGNYPAAVALIQQRLLFANTTNNPETIYASRTGKYNNFTNSFPMQDDDAITFSLAGKQVNRVKHLLDIGKLLVFTSAGEWAVEGNEAGVITPSAINLKQYSYNGSSDLPPLVLGGNALYVQARGSIVRDLGFDVNADGYRGNDLTIFSAHMFDGYQLEDWTYQQIPHSIVWIVRDDGTLLGLTYVREHQLVAWHRHDFGGTVENVCSVPEGSEDALYLTIKRTINGSTKRYIERMNTRLVSDVLDYVGMDCALSYDGRNTTTARTMTLSGGTTWEYTETLTLTCSQSFFTAADVDNAIHLTGSDGELIRFTIKGYTSGTVVTGKAHKTVPASLRTTATSSWTKAVDVLSGLWHIEGQQVSVFADGFVVASPNNEAYVTRTVSNGSVTLDKPYGVIHVGIPITADLETLDIDMPQGETLSDKKKNISKVTAHLEKSRGLFMGSEPPSDDSVDPLEGLYELKIRGSEHYDDPVALQTGPVDINIQSHWNSNGRVFIRQVDPVPLTILAIAPTGLVPIRG